MPGEKAHDNPPRYRRGTAVSMGQRFQVKEGSQSAHCCFEATVVDTAIPRIVGGKQCVRDGEPQWEAVCECFDLEDAKDIAHALNLAEDEPCPSCHGAKGWADEDAREWAECPDCGGTGLAKNSITANELRRDEAAELRAAIKEWAESDDLYGSEGTDENRERYFDAIDNLRRLAGMEDEK